MSIKEPSIHKPIPGTARQSISEFKPIDETTLVFKNISPTKQKLSAKLIKPENYQK